MGIFKDKVINYLLQEIRSPILHHEAYAEPSRNGLCHLTFSQGSLRIKGAHEAAGELIALLL